MEKWKGKYRIPSARAAWWDYSRNGVYFITICTRDREHFLGECVDGKMTLSTVGAIVQGFWYEIPKHFPFVWLGEFVVMPNHIHGILVLDKTDMGDDNDGGVIDDDTRHTNMGVIDDTNDMGNMGVIVEIGHCPISTMIVGAHDTPKNQTVPPKTIITRDPIVTSAPNDKNNDQKTIAQQRFRNQGKHTVSSIIGSYKSICTKHINKTFPDMAFGWQKLFWDNIVRDDAAFQNISKYIRNNPAKWKEDRFFPDKSTT